MNDSNQIPHFLNSQHHHEMVEHIFSFLETDDLANCRLVCKRFNSLAKQDKLFNPSLQKIKIAYDEYFTHLTEIQTQEKTIKNKIEKKEEEFDFAENSNKFSFLEFHFPSIYKKELDENRNRIFREINDLKLELTKTISLYSTVKINVLKTKYEKEKNYCSRFNKLKNLLGGKEAYEALPVLDLGDYCDDYLDSIKSALLTAPIMRGCDIAGRRFFIMRVQFRNPMNGYSYFGVPSIADENIYYVAIHERNPNDSIWVASSPSSVNVLIDSEGYPVTGSLFYDPIKLDALANFIKNKGNEEFKVC